jgi:hypothetical protein
MISGLLYDTEMEVKNWMHPAKHIRIIDGHEVVYNKDLYWGHYYFCFT